jgi:hypothetical protein
MQRVVRCYVFKFQTQLAMIINSTVIEIDEDKFWKSLKYGCL